MSVGDLKAPPCRHCRKTWRECMAERNHCCDTCRKQGGH